MFPQSLQPSEPMKLKDFLWLFLWFKKTKTEESPRPRMLYATLSFTKMPFAEDKSQPRCTFSFRIVDSVDVFPRDERLDSAQEGGLFKEKEDTIYYGTRRVPSPIYFRLRVYTIPNYEYTYTSVLRIGALEDAMLSQIGFEITSENRWSRTVGKDVLTVRAGIARMFMGHPKVHRFLSDSEQTE